MPKKFSITYPLNNLNNCKKIQSLIVSLFNQEGDKKYVIVIKEGEDNRSNKQNRLLYLWIKEIDDQTKEGKQYIRNYLKFTFGCEIVAMDDEVFSEFYTKLVSTYTYEQCVESMEFVEVSSRMKVKQFASYLSDIENYAASRDLHLTHPDDLYFEALMKTGE